MDATCTIQDSIHVFNLVHKYVSRILGTYQTMLKQIGGFFHIIKKSPNHKSGNWSQLGKECTYTNIPPNDFEKRAEIIG